MMTQLTSRTYGLGQKSSATTPSSPDNKKDEQPDGFAALLAASWFTLLGACTGAPGDITPENPEGATGNSFGAATPADSETLAAALGAADASSSLLLNAEDDAAPLVDSEALLAHFDTGASEALEMGAWDDVWKVGAGETDSPKPLGTANSLRDSASVTNAFAEATRKVRSTLSHSSVKPIVEEGRAVVSNNADVLQPSDHASADEASRAVVASGSAAPSHSTGTIADSSDSQAVLRQTIGTISMMAERLQPRETRSLRLRLHPEELGPIDVRLTRGDEGGLSAHLTAESEDAHRALAEGIDHLREALERAGMVVDQIEVSFDQSLSANSGGQADGRRADHPARTNFAEPVSAKSVTDDTPVVLDSRLLNLRA